MEINHVVCPFCGCLCDDTRVVIENGEIVKTTACANGNSKLMHHDTHRIETPKIRRNGKLREATLNEAIKKAADILSDAYWPLFYGLSSTECHAIRKTIELAEMTGGVVDNTSSVCHGPTKLAIQRTGAVEASLGEIKNRADLVIFWGSNPTSSHPKHLNRYSVFPSGLKIPNGRADRTVIVVDVRETSITQIADSHIKVEPNKDFELFSALRCLIQGYELNEEEIAGVSREKIEKVAEQMKTCRYGVIFFGLGLSMSRGKHRNIDMALHIVRDLNKYTRFVLLPMRGHYNVAGANIVSSWLTGYPFGVDFSRGYPRYNPGEFTAVDILSRREADAAFIVASDPVATLPRKAAQYLTQIPTIAIDPKKSVTTQIADVVIPAATAGIEAPGTAYRMDGVPLRLKKVIDSEHLPDARIIEKIIEAVKEVV